jgi:hypothetical protein
MLLTAVLRQGNETPQEFYVRCQQMLSKIINFINLNVNEAASKIVKRTFYTEQALQTFIAGLKDPLGTQIRCMQPTSLPMALKYVQKEQNIRYIQNSFPSTSSNRNMEPRQQLMLIVPTPRMVAPVPQSQQRPIPGNPSPFAHTYRVFKNQGPVQNQQGFKTNHFQNRFQNPNRFFYSPRPQFNYGTQSSPQASQSRPVPMSGVSTIKNTPRFRPGGQDLANFQNPTTSYFRSREINLNRSYPYEPEQYYYNTQESDESYDYCPEYYAVEYPSNNDDNSQETFNSGEFLPNSDRGGSGKGSPRVTEINLQSNRVLPYIQISNPPLKLLIDTGANQSFIAPEAVDNYFSDFPILHEPFVVTNIHCTTKNDYAIILPIFQKFQESGDSKFFIYKFHDTYDGLLGLDFLNRLKARIDLGENLLKTNNAINKIRMLKSGVNNLFECIIKSQSTQRLKLPVSLKYADVIVTEANINGCLIHDTITKARDGKAIIEVSNNTPNDVIFSLNKPLPCSSVKNFDCFNFDIIANNKNNIKSLIRTDHLNQEEKAKIERLCENNSDIFS